MKKVTHIIFDLSEVLIRGLVGIESSVITLTGDRRQDVLRKFGGENLIHLCKNRITENQYIENIINREDWKYSTEQLKILIRQNFNHVIESMDELVGKLSNRYTCILLSDHAREWVEYIEQYHGFLNKFSCRLYSFMTGHIKDEKYNFQKILNDLNISATTCLFVDDSPKNIHTAQQCGIQSIVFKDQKQLILDLARFGIAT